MGLLDVQVSWVEMGFLWMQSGRMPHWGVTDMGGHMDIDWILYEKLVQLAKAKNRAAYSEVAPL